MSSSAPPLTRQTLLDWPKAELHCHLDGSMRLDTMLDLARQQGKTALLPADSVDGLEERLREVDQAASLAAYLEWFQYTLPVLQSEQALRRTAYELAADNVQEHVRYLEVRFAPLLHTEEGLSLEAVTEAVLDGLDAAERDLNIRTALIICGLRDRPASTSMRQAELAVDYRDRGVVAFDLAGLETGHPAKHHLGAFHHARNHLLSLTIHAGESYGPASIRQALFVCDTHRVGHGTTLHRDPSLVQYFADHQIPLEICPTSNVQTQVADSLAAHPLTTYVQADIPITINTDNRLFSRTSVTEELWRVHQHCGLGRQALRRIVLNGFQYAFLRWDEKKDLLRRVKRDLPPAGSPPVAS